VAQTTATPPIDTKKSLAKLSLKENYEFLIKEFEKIFGREDFLGMALTDDLLFIGKRHFKITKMDDGFYIEDLDTKNGTKLNGEEIRGSGKVKLENGDEILVAKILNISYNEEKT
jgi:pSer/pThr/pTyr-binding forkhead associated (FHA) protein